MTLRWKVLSIALMVLQSVTGNAAGDSPNCLPSAKPEITGIETLIQKIECPTEDERRLLEARAEYDALFPPTKGWSTSREIHGVKIKGTEEQLDLLERILGSKPPSTWAEARACRDVLCALTRAFKGEEPAIRALSIAKKYGYAPVVGQEESAANDERIWTARQLRVMSDVLKLLPKSFHQMESLKTIHLISSNSAAVIDRNSGGSDSFLGLMNGGTQKMHVVAADGDNDHTVETFIHELGHAYDFNHGYGQHCFHRDSKFADISGWPLEERDADGKTMPLRPGKADQQFLRDYSKSSPWEDFADAVRFYVLEPKRFRQMAPEKYALVKSKVFNGEEFGQWGERSWPALENAIRAKGGYEPILASCLSDMSLSWSDKNQDLWIRAGVNSISSHVAALATQSRCFEKSAKGLAAALASDEAFCDQGGVNGIEAHLRAKLSNPLIQMLHGFETLGKEQVRGAAAQRCWGRKDYSADCLFSQEDFGRVLAALPSGVSAADRSMIERKLQESLDGLLSPKMGEHLAKTIHRGDLAADCLRGLAGIRRSSDGFWFSDGKFSGSSASSLDGCTDQVRTGMEKKGYRFSQNARRVATELLVAGNVKDPLQDLEVSVLQPLRELIKPCRNDKCRKQNIRKALDAWAVKWEVPSAQLPPKFEEKLLKWLR